MFIVQVQRNRAHPGLTPDQGGFLEYIQNTKIESIRSKFCFLPVFGTLTSTQRQAEGYISIAITINWAQNLS